MPKTLSTLATAVFCLGGCISDPTPVFVDVHALGKELVVFGFVNQGEQLIGGSFIDLTDPNPAGVQLHVPADGRVVGLAFDRAELLARAPRLDKSRLAETRFVSRRTDTANCAEGALNPAERSASVRWPENALAFQLDQELTNIEPVSAGEAWFGRAALSAPIALSRCDGHREIRIQPLAQKMPFLEEGVVIGGVPIPQSRLDLKEFVRIDERRVLIAQGPWVILVDQDTGFVDGPERFVQASTGWGFSSVTAGPADPETGIIRVVAVEGTRPVQGAGANISRLLEATLDGDRLIRGVAHFETEAVFDSTYIQPSSRRLLVYQPPSTVYEEETPGGKLVPVASLQDLPIDVDKRGRFVPTSVPERPVALVGSHQSSFYLGSADNRAWENLKAGLPPAVTHRAFAQIENANGSYSLFGGNTFGQALQRLLSDDGWRPFEVRLDPSLIDRQCGTPPPDDNCGFAVSKLAWQSFTPLGSSSSARTLLAFMDRCPAAFVIGMDGCTTHWLLGELGDTVLDGRDEIVIVRSEAGFVTLGTEFGRFYEIPWSELGLP